MTVLRIFFGGLVVLSCAQVTHAASYPEKPLRLIVPFAPGGGSDVSGRIIASKMSEFLGQQVVIDNRPGAAGSIGAAVVAKSEPDGYTMLLADTGFATAISIYSKTGYHPIKDFAPVSLAATTPIIVVVHPSVPATSMRELIALAKKNPGSLNAGSGGSGGSVHLATELFQLQTGTKLTHVPYKGAGPAAIDLVGGQLDLMLSTAPPVIPLIQARRVRPLAVASAARSTLFPELPTMKEAGVDFVATNWYGIVVPAGAPKTVIERLHEQIAKATVLPDVRQRLAAAGLEPSASPSPQAFGTFLSEEVVRWAKVIKQANIKLE